jgi:hypothetical protein
MRRDSSMSKRLLPKLSRIEITIGSDVYDIDVAAEINTVQESLENTLDWHTDRFAFWRLLLMRARNRAARTEILLSEQRETVYASLVTHYEQSGTRKPTERLLSEQVSNHPTVLKLRTRLLQAREAEEQARAVCDIFEHRRSMLMKQTKSAE